MNYLNYNPIGHEGHDYDRFMNNKDYFIGN